MRPINNAVDELFQPRELAEDEYLNEADGLMYCSKMPHSQTAPN